MKLSMIIPTVNQVNMLFNCVDSFIQHNGKDHEIIVVDDGSMKDIRIQVQHGCKARNIKFLYNEVNSGFAHTVNKGIKEACGDVVTLLNNDLTFTQNITEPIIDSFKRDPKVGITGALLFYPKKGTIQHGGVVRIGNSFTHRGWHQMLSEHPSLTKPMYLIAVTGALFSMRKDMLNEVGLFNEEYFLASEDVEICLRAWIKDWKVLYNPDIRAQHHEGGTRGASDAEKMVKGRVWMLKELETRKKFEAWTRTLDFRALDSKVNNANAKVFVQQIDTNNKTVQDFVKVNFVSSKDKVDENVKVIGVRRSGAFGDVLLSTPVLKKLKETYPKAQLWVATHCPQALEKNIYVDKIVHTVEQIPSDLIFDLDMVYESNPKMNVTDAYSMAVFGSLLEENDRKQVIFNSNNEDSVSMMMKIRSVDFSKDRIIVAHMARSWDNRTWMRERWCEVAKHFSLNGYKFIVIGRGEDFKADLYTNVLNVHNLLSVFEIKELIKRAKCFVGMDSGMLHIAQSTNTPIVGLFTVANPEYRIVRKENTHAIIPQVECAFCLHEQPPPVTFVGCARHDLACLKSITTRQVIEAVHNFVRL